MKLLKPNEKCAACKRVIDQEGTAPDKSSRLGLLEDGQAYCRRCATTCEDHPEYSHRGESL
jgi:hypothetical protein